MNKLTSERLNTGSLRFRSELLLLPGGYTSSPIRDWKKTLGYVIRHRPALGGYELRSNGLRGNYTGGESFESILTGPLPRKQFPTEEAAIEHMNKSWPKRVKKYMKRLREDYTAVKLCRVCVCSLCTQSCGLKEQIADYNLTEPTEHHYILQEDRDKVQQAVKAHDWGEHEVQYIGYPWSIQIHIGRNVIDYNKADITVRWFDKSVTEADQNYQYKDVATIEEACEFAQTIK